MKPEDKLPLAIAGDVREVFDIRRVDLAAIEQSGALLDTKDLARAFRLHVRTVKRLWKRVNVPPMIGGNFPHRWTYRQAQLLLSRWQELAEKNGHIRSWNNGRTSGLR